MLRAPILACGLALGALAAGLALAPEARAQYAEGGARHLAMGRTGVALGGQAWGHANPATWATAPRSAGLEASRAYGLDGLRLAGATVAAPLAFGTLAVTGRTYGSGGYTETRLLAGGAREVPLSSARSLAVGVAAGYDGVSIDGFGSTGTVHLSAGVQGEMVPGLRVGLAVRNALGIAGDAEADLDRPLGAVPGVVAGLAYAPSERATLTADAVQDLDGELSVRAGLEARVAEPLALRVGVGTAPVTYSAGIGVLAGPLGADVAVEVHEVLGLTPAVSLQVGF